MKKEKPKRTEVITFRTTPEIKEELEKEAEIRGWSVSQLTERIIASYVYKGYSTTPQEINLAIQNNRNININGG